MKKLYLFSCFFLILASTRAQGDFGIKLSAGFSSVAMKKPCYMPSGQAGFFYNYHLKKSYIGTELLFSQIEEKFVWLPVSILLSPSGTSYSSYAYYHLSYLSIPIYYGHNFGKFSISAGLQTSFLLYGLTNGIERIPEGLCVSINHFRNKAPIKTFDLGTKFAFSYAFSKKISLEMTYYYGIIDTYKNTQMAGFNFKAQQLNIGVRYIFTRNKKQ